MTGSMVDLGIDNSGTRSVCLRLFMAVCVCKEKERGKTKEEDGREKEKDREGALK